MIQIPDLSRFIRFRTSRSGGKGGQHVNKTESRVELIFDFTGCDAFSAEVHDRIRKKVGAQLNQDGELIVTSEKYRSQIENREDALSKLYKLLEKAAKQEKKRINTKPTKASRLKKREKKEQRSEIKSSRRKIKF